MLAQLLKYGIVGVLNTAITFLVIAAFTALGANPYLSNAVGFGAGLLNSYLLNSHFTFKQKFTLEASLKFAVAFSISYALNLITLHYLIMLSTVPIILAQFIAMLMYNLAFFILMSTWVFKYDDK